MLRDNHLSPLFLYLFNHIYNWCIATYKIAIPQLACDKVITTGQIERPSSAIAGAMVSGPMYGINSPNTPVSPKIISVADPTIKEPDIY